MSLATTSSREHRGSTIDHRRVVDSTICSAIRDEAFADPDDRIFSSKSSVDILDVIDGTGSLAQNLDDQAVQSSIAVCCARLRTYSTKLENTDCAI